MIEVKMIALSVGKPEQRGEENADYCDYSVEENGLTYAISDGASDSSFPDVWAKILVEDYIKSPYFSKQELENRIGRLSKKWSEKINSLGELPYFAQLKMEKGSYATLVGLGIYPLENGRRTWESIAIGDSCLFQFNQKNELIFAYPVKSSAEFSSRPYAISNIIEKNKGLEIIKQRGNWENGDTFILATDALAKWIFEEYEKGKSSLKTLTKLYSINKQKRGPEFKRWVEHKRKNNEIDTDDTTFIMAQLNIKNKKSSSTDKYKIDKISSIERMESERPKQKVESIKRERKQDSKQTQQQPIEVGEWANDNNQSYTPPVNQTQKKRKRGLKPIHIILLTLTTIMMGVTVFLALDYFDVLFPQKPEFNDENLNDSEDAGAVDDNLTDSGDAGAVDDNLTDSGDAGAVDDNFSEEKAIKKQLPTGGRSNNNIYAHVYIIR